MTPWEGERRETPLDMLHADNDVVVLLYQFLAETVSDGIIGFHHESDPPFPIEVDNVVLDVAVNPVNQSLNPLQ